jgi:hypothetical protein
VASGAVIEELAAMATAYVLVMAVVGPLAARYVEPLVKTVLPRKASLRKPRGEGPLFGCGELVVCIGGDRHGRGKAAEAVPGTQSFLVAQIRMPTVSFVLLVAQHVIGGRLQKRRVQ